MFSHHKTLNASGLSSETFPVIFKRTCSALIMCRFCVCLLHIFCLCIDASHIENKPFFKPGCTKPEPPPRCIKGKRLAHKEARRKPVQDVVMISFCGETRKKTCCQRRSSIQTPPPTLLLLPPHNWYLPERHLENALGCRIINIRAVLPPPPLFARAICIRFAAPAL